MSCHFLTSRIAAALLFVSLVSPLQADTHWIRSPSQSGDWSNSSNWDGGVPTSSTSAYIVNGGTATISQSGEVASNLYLGNTGAANSGTIQMDGGDFTLGNGYVGYSGTGTFSQQDGANNTNYLYLGYNSTGTGTYNLSGTSSLNMNTNNSSAEYIGYSGHGTLTQSGGTNSVDFFCLGYNSTGNGTYNLSNNGYLWCTWEEEIGFQGGTGTFTQSGGTNTASTTILIGDYASAKGTYNLYGGTLISSSVEIGISGSGALTQSGGSHTVGQCYLGVSSGSGIYQLSNVGYLNCTGEEDVGYQGSGTFTQTGGTNTIAQYLYIGSASGGRGTYTLSGTGSLSSLYEYVGNWGSGTLTQSGGTNTISSALYLGYNSSGNGTYYLNGGTLVLNSLSKGSGAAAFNFGNGTLRASSSFTTNLPMTLTGNGGSANVDTAGNSVTFSGSLSGAGGLNKLGTNTLTLSGPNTYTGNTSISGGTLTLASTGSLVLAVNETTSGQIAVASGAELDLYGTIKLDIGDIVASSETWTLVSNSGISVYEPSFSLTTTDGASFTQANDIWSYTAESQHWTFTEATGVLSLTTVPEPSTCALLAIGFFGVLGYRYIGRRRKHGP